MKSFITNSAKQTQKLGEILTEEILDIQCPKNVILCLTGELGSGKTTFTQGLLKGLKIKGPYTSPTFLVMKHYKKKIPISNFQFPISKQIQNSKFKILNIYHIDAYRVTAKDILNLGWKEIIANKNNIIIIEWADRIKKIIPARAVWIKFKWVDEKKRKITFMSSRAV